MAAEVHYQAAKKRMGILGSSLFDIQCLFFASVFEKYALRPVEAWFYIQMACTRLEAMLLRNPRQGARRSGRGRRMKSIAPPTYSSSASFGRASRPKGLCRTSTCSHRDVVQSASLALQSGGMRADIGLHRSSSPSSGFDPVA